MAKPITWRSVTAPSVNSGTGALANATRAFDTAGRAFQQAGEVARERRTDAALGELMADGQISRDELGGLGKGVNMKTILDAQRMDQTSREQSASRGILDALNEQKRIEAVRENSPEFLAEEARRRKVEEETAQAQLEAAQAQVGIAQSRENRLAEEAEFEEQQRKDAAAATEALSTRSGELFTGISGSINDRYDQAIARQTEVLTQQMGKPAPTERDTKALEDAISEATRQLNLEREQALAKGRARAGTLAYGQLVSEKPQLAQWLGGTQQAADYGSARDAANQTDALGRAAAEAEQSGINKLLTSSSKEPASAAVTINANGQPALVNDAYQKGSNNTTPENLQAYADQLGVSVDHPEFQEIARLARGNLSAMKAAISQAGGRDFDLFSRNDLENFDLAKEHVQRYAAIAEGFAASMKKANATVSPAKRKELIDEANNNWQDAEFVKDYLNRKGIKTSEDAAAALVEASVQNNDQTSAALDASADFL